MTSRAMDALMAAHDDANAARARVERKAVAGKPLSRPTFRREPRPTGLARVGSTARRTTVKTGGRVVGYLTDAASSAGRGGWSINLMRARSPHAITTEFPCRWEWVRFRVRCATEAEARDWLRNSWETIQGLMTLTTQEDT